MNEAVNVPKSGNKVRKNITLNAEQFYTMERFAKKVGISFSQLVEKATYDYVQEQENLDLAEFLRANCNPVPKEEENEIIEVLKEYDKNDPGRELTLEEIL